MLVITRKRNNLIFNVELNKNKYVEILDEKADIVLNDAYSSSIMVVIDGITGNTTSLSGIQYHFERLNFDTNEKISTSTIYSGELSSTPFEIGKYRLIFDKNVVDSYMFDNMTDKYGNVLSNNSQYVTTDSIYRLNYKYQNNTSITGNNPNIVYDGSININFYDESGILLEDKRSWTLYTTSSNTIYAKGKGNTKIESVPNGVYLLEVAKIGMFVPKINNSTQQITSSNKNIFFNVTILVI